jgi:putative transposase
MIATIFLLFYSALAGLRSRAALQAEILALRHQLLVLHRSNRKRRLQVQNLDRAFWVLLSNLWSGWRSALVIVKPATVIAWHRKGFRLYWTWKSRVRLGRHPIPKETCDLIRRMSIANPLWGAPRIHGELLKLGIELAQATVAKYMVRKPKPPSQTWKTFLTNHLKDIVSTDFFVVPTVNFRLIFVFLVLSHERRRPIHFGVTYHPTAEWTSQQLVQAFPWDSAPKYLLRDRDGSYGQVFSQTASTMGIEEVLTTPHCPWQNPYCERMVGSIRRECLDHVIILSEHGLRRIWRSYFDYYERSRTHLALEKDTPLPRPVQSPALGKVIELPEVGGLHHRYERRAA